MINQPPESLVKGCNDPISIGVLSDWIEEQYGVALDYEQSGWSDYNIFFIKLGDGCGRGYGYVVGDGNGDGIRYGYGYGLDGNGKGNGCKNGYGIVNGIEIEIEINISDGRGKGSGYADLFGNGGAINSERDYYW